MKTDSKNISNECEIEYVYEYVTELVSEEGESEFEYYSEYVETDVTASLDKGSRESGGKIDSSNARRKGNKSPNS